MGFHTFRHTCVTILFGRGWNAVQVQRGLSHHSPSFTLDRYVVLLNEEIPEPTFFDELEVATRAAETSRNEEVAEVAEAAL